MKSVIALVGRPNVGKSTLFNRLTRTQNALVADFPGLTRDRKYGEVEFDNRNFLIVDTGGIGVEDIAVDTLMSKQSAIAIEEAEIVFFLVDARDGLTPVDDDIARKLRKVGKKVYLIINKIDGLNSEIALTEFQRLGFNNMFGISATNALGINDLLTKVSKDLPIATEEEVDEDVIKVAFIGRPNVGKSTLVNALLKEERVVVYDLPGTTRDSIYIPFQRNDEEYILIDTAGMRRRSRIDEKIESFSVIKTIQAINDANVCVMVIDATEKITDQDLHLLGFILESGRSLVIAVNKWDDVDTDQKDFIKEELARRLRFVEFAKIKFISAKFARGISGLFNDINSAYNSAMKTISTSKLTNILLELVSKHPPPLVKSRRIKLRFAHLGGHNPPLIIIHGNQTESLPEDYKRYLINNFVLQLKLIGTQVKLAFKSGDNPYKEKRNLLTDRQIKQKKRLMKHVKRR